MNIYINNNYPDFCFRGIRKQGWITLEKRICGSAFAPDKRTTNQDGFQETSINWEDNQDVLDFCLKEFKDAFAFGAIKLPKKEIDSIIEHEPPNWLSYERKQTPDNPFHGNILFNQEISTQYKRAIQGSLAQRSLLVKKNK